MSNIIDFNSRKKKKGANAKTPPAGFQEMMDAATLLFKDLPQHEMMFDAVDALKRCVYKFLLFTSLKTQVNEAIQKAGLDCTYTVMTIFPLTLPLSSATHAFRMSSKQYCAP